jgi:2-amino-4-hydroxy-6-hydroxymethyldihydropteridine diphosphokinase
MIAYVGVGANLGDAQATVIAAIARLGDLPQTRVLRVSPLYRSAPIDAVGPDFVNAVAEIDTTLSPGAVLDGLQAIEAAFGRVRTVRNAPRTLDLDLLLAGDTRLDDPRLTLPHARMAGRAFVLAPLVDLAPELEVPGLGSVRDLLAGLSGQSIQKIA